MKAALLFLLALSHPTFRAQSGNQVATVHIEGLIDASVRDPILKTLSNPSLSRLDVLINSPGGLVPEARDIVSAFESARSRGVRIKCTVDDQAMSAAFWILQACTERVGTVTSRYMIHAPMVQINGYLTIRNLEEIHEVLVRDYMLMASTIAPRMGLSIKDYVQLTLDATWYMNATQAIAAHAIDRIVQ